MDKILKHIPDEVVKFENFTLKITANKIHSVCVSKTNLHLTVIWRELILTDHAF